MNQDLFTRITLIGHIRSSEIETLNLTNCNNKLHNPQWRGKQYENDKWILY